MKYIIDVPNQDYSYDEIFHTLKLKFYDDNLSCEVSFDAKPYTEPDRKAIDLQHARDIENVAKMNYNEGAKDAWDFASKLMNMHPDVAEDIYWSMNGGKGIGVAAEMTYQEAKSKYDAWKAEHEICVGDEIEAEPGKKACVLYENPGGTQLFVFKADGTAAWWSKCAIHKTGKNHSEVAELLKKMREKE